MKWLFQVLALVGCAGASPSDDPADPSTTPIPTAATQEVVSGDQVYVFDWAAHAINSPFDGQYGDSVTLMMGVGALPDCTVLFTDRGFPIIFDDSRPLADISFSSRLASGSILTEPSDDAWRDGESIAFNEELFDVEHACIETVGNGSSVFDCDSSRAETPPEVHATLEATSHFCGDFSDE